MRGQLWTRGLLVAILALGGCGDGDSSGARGTTVTTGAGVTITIEAPADGAALPARGKADTLRLSTRVRGRAPAGSTVLLSASCRPKSCGARATAGADGRWAATMALTAPRAARFLTIDASARQAVAGEGSAVATIELVGPRSAAAQPPRSQPSSERDRPPPPAVRRTLRKDVLVIGDSLAMGMAEPLKVALPGWKVVTDGSIGRPLAEGMEILAAQTSAPALLALSLFTNDEPGNLGALESAVRATATRPGGCAVWATVVRPPLNGVSYDGANALLRRLASDPQLALGIQLVDWEAEVKQSPSLIAGDGVHATPSGYRARALMFARAIQACAGA